MTDLYGIGPLVAARFIAEVVDVRRYPDRNAFAAANGTAPLPASSGRTVRHRFNPGGNRQLNRALYTIAITQIRGDTEGRGLLRTQTRRRQNQTRSPALSEADDCPTSCSPPCDATPLHAVTLELPTSSAAGLADRDWGGCGRRK